MSNTKPKKCTENFAFGFQDTLKFILLNKKFKKSKKTIAFSKEVMYNMFTK